MIPDLPYGQFHTLPGLLESWAALPNSYPNALRAMQGGSLYHFYDGFWYDPAERGTHDLPCERRTRYRLSQPDTVNLFVRGGVPILEKMVSLKLILPRIYLWLAAFQSNTRVCNHFH